MKRKLDSYLTSGLLTQLQDISIAGQPNQLVVSTSSRLQCSGDDNGYKGTEGEEVSECSQESANTSRFTNLVFNTSEEPKPREDTSCSDFIEQIDPHDPGNSASRDQFAFHAPPDISSSELDQECSFLRMDIADCDESHKIVSVPLDTSVGSGISTSMVPPSIDLAKQDDMLISDEECYRVLGNISLSPQPSDIHIPDTGGTSTSFQTYPVKSSGLVGSSCPQSPMLSANDGKLVYPTEADHVLGPDDLQFVSRAHNSFICANNSSIAPSMDAINGGESHNKEDHVVPVNTLGCASDVRGNCYLMEETTDVHVQQLETGTLCYEPPRFPSLDIPFLSCDLLQSGGDMQQDFSPFGIRRFIMSTMNCPSPLRLWDTPCRDNSPDALLKSAAKNFTGTPSIMKKRHRDLLSPPPSDKRVSKKLETELTSTLATHSSPLEVMVGNNEAQEVGMLSQPSPEKDKSGATLEDAENFVQSLKGENEMEIYKSTLSNQKSGKETASIDSRDFQRPTYNDSKMKVDCDVSSGHDFFNVKFVNK